MPVTGHWSLAGVRDHRLQAYIAAGVDSCHETTSREDALAKLRAGMWVQFREGSTFRDVAALAPVLTEDGVDPRHCLLVTDDVLPETIVADGHMDRVLRRAIEEGIDPLIAIQMATVNGAEYFGLRHDLGSIAPGPARRHPVRRGPPRLPPAPRARRRRGDRGSSPAYEYPARGVRLDPASRGRSTVEDLRIEASGRARSRARDRQSPGELATEHLVVELPVVDGEVPAAPALDVAKAASIERHGGPGTIGVGFVQGLGLQRGAVASSVAHDNHNLLVAGMSDDDMLFARRAPARDRAAGWSPSPTARSSAWCACPIAGLMSRSARGRGRRPGARARGRLRRSAARSRTRR